MACWVVACHAFGLHSTWLRLGKIGGYQESLLALRETSARDAAALRRTQCRMQAAARAPSMGVYKSLSKSHHHGKGCQTQACYAQSDQEHPAKGDGSKEAATCQAGLQVVRQSRRGRPAPSCKQQDTLAISFSVCLHLHWWLASEWASIGLMTAAPRLPVSRTGSTHPSPVCSPTPDKQGRWQVAVAHPRSSSLRLGLRWRSAESSARSSCRPRHQHGVNSTCQTCRGSCRDSDTAITTCRV